MGRLARNQILYDGCYAHIYSRAMDECFIFDGPSDFEYFKSLLKDTKRRYRYRIHHYCLMHTHYHLAISLEKVELFAKAMKEIKRLYVNRFHKELRGRGPLWWGRYGSQLIEDERYLYACGLYIENNPVKAGMVASPADWPYSSSRHYFLGQTDELVDDYEKTGHEEAIALSASLELGKGPVLGSELFQIHWEEELERV